MIVLTAFGLVSACSDSLQNLANTEASDLTDVGAYPKAGNKSDGLISAFYGLDAVSYTHLTLPTKRIV